jgi:preprotein translocase subunit SecD
MKNINQLKLLGVIALAALSVYIIWSMPINLGLDLQGGSQLILEAQDTKDVKVTPDAVKGVVTVIRNRIDALGVTEPVIEQKGGRQIIVELPGIKDPERAIKVIGDTALLEFIESEWSPGDKSVITDAKLKDIYGPDARLGDVEMFQDGKVVSSKPIILKKNGIDRRRPERGLAGRRFLRQSCRRYRIQFKGGGYFRRGYRPQRRPSHSYPS